MKTIVIASHNIGKVIELRQLMLQCPIDVTLLSLKQLDICEPEETETTFEKNALLKARHAFEKCRLACLADDSGLEVHALNGAPGIYSARWARNAQGKRDFKKAMRTIHEKIKNQSDWRARFVCALAWITPPDGHATTFIATCDGHLCWPTRGNHGFGYDPMFVPSGYQKTFSEMTPEEKQPLSHRYRAFQKWQKHVFPTD